MRMFALTWLAACSFSTDVPGADDGAPDAGEVTPTPSTRCTAAGLAVCIDFEDMPTPKDGIVPEAAITAVDITPQIRLDERSAELKQTSQIRIAETSKLDIGQALTIEMWTKPTAVPPDKDDKQAGLFETYLQYQMSFETDRQVECHIENTLGSDNLDSKDPLALNVWHHVACTYDGAVMKVYVDGKLKGCKSATRTISIYGGAGAAVGANMTAIGYKNPFVGELDNVHVYARALPAAEICTLWGNGACDDRCPGGPGGPDDD